MSSTRQDRIGVVCSTYRNPEKPSLARLYGIMSLVDQIEHQSIDAKTRIVVVDDSPAPHPFIEGLNGAMDDRLSYFHVPKRNEVVTSLKSKFNDAVQFMPTDKDFETPYWQSKLQQIKAWESFLPFDYEFAKQFKINMLGQVLADRPTIGMKKNFGCAAYREIEGSVPDFFVYVDDDDLRSPEYLRIVRDGIQGNDFARVIKTFAHNISEDPAKRFWGEIDFKLQPDVNGNWTVPPEVMDASSYKFDESGNMSERPVYDLYPRNLMLAWPIISHDGALHNYTGGIWERAAEEFGGFFPTSFSEDIITFKQMSSLSGFRAATIPVEEAPFIRCADGRNASDFYCTKVLEAQNVPSWTIDALKPLYTGIEASLPYEAHEDVLRDMGREYAQTRKLNLNALQPKGM